MTLHCRTCRAVLAPAARFCGQCGTPSRTHARAVVARGHAERRQALRAALSLGALCGGTFVALLVGPEALGVTEDGWGAHFVHAAELAVVGLAAAIVGGGLRGTSPLAVRWPWLLAAAPAAAGSMAFARLFLGMLGLRVEGDAAALLPTWVAAVVLAPLVEEWLCRGVAWRAAERLATPATALLVTSVLFGFLHGLGGGYLLELPHRFVAGLVFGWLRWRSGSLLPGLLAHAIHNGLASGWPGS